MDMVDITVSKKLKEVKDRRIVQGNGRIVSERAGLGIVEDRASPRPGRLGPDQEP